MVEFIDEAQRLISPKKNNPLSEEISKDCLPKVTYAEELARGSEQYAVEFDSAAFGQLLLDYGVPPLEIPNITIDFQLSYKGDEDDYFANYDKFNKKISLFTRPVWKKYNAALDTALQISNGSIEPSERQFENLVVTKRLSSYLATAPKERGMKFANKLLNQGASHAISKNIVHEAGHVIDDITNRNIALIIGSLFTGLFVNGAAQSVAYSQVFLLSLINNRDFQDVATLPTTMLVANLFGIFVQIATQYGYSWNENSATGFANQLTKDPRYREIITMNVKNTIL